MIAVQIVLEKLASLVTDETYLLGGVHREISELRDDLNSMKSFLQDAEAESESSQVVKTWVNQVRDVACDTEDALEEFMLRFQPHHGRGFIHSLRNCYHYVWQLKGRHRLAVQIQNIKGRIKAISERRDAFSFNKVDEVTASSSDLSIWHVHKLGALYIDDADVVGIEKPKNQLIAWLVGGEQKLTAVSVVGMGGLGKTTLVKKAYDSQPIKGRFSCWAWVTVSKSFKVVDLLRVALKGFLEATKEAAPAPEEIDTMGDLLLVDALRNHLQQKKYLIVLDDVWSVNAWEVVKYALPDSNCGSRIIFTTRLGNIAASIEANIHVYHLQPLPEKEAWNLFCMKAFRGEHKGVCPEELKEISQCILKKCGGLPLAIVTIGGLLSRKEKMVLEWKKVYDSLGEEMKSDHNLESLGRILLLSYNDLPYYLKSCYLYLSVFPEDYLIPRMKLVRLWLVERFVQEKRGHTMEEVAEEYLNELVHRSMIQAVEIDPFNRVRTCRVHDLMREIIQSKSREESLMMVMNERSMTVNEKIRRLSIHQSCETFPSGKKYRGLWSLFLFTSGNSFTSFPREFFHGFRLLRVLDLELTPLYEFPSMVVELIYLRYLSLRRTMVREIPESIGKLKGLEILDLKGTLVSTLPVGILKLKQLSQLQNYRFRFISSLHFANTFGMTVPKGIGGLTNLQKLGDIEVNQDTDIVRELGSLTQLRKLGILELTRKDGIDLCSSLARMSHLTSLYMFSISNHETLELGSLLSPPQFLQRLYLKCGLATLPEWITSLCYLTKLVLQYSNLYNDPLRMLQKLPNLIVLELRVAYVGEELYCEARGYPRLKKLGLYLLNQLKCVKVEEGAMSVLRELHIASCRNLEMVPSGIEHLRNLQELLIWDMPHTFLTRIEQNKGEDFCKVQHIPTIKHVY